METLSVGAPIHDGRGQVIASLSLVVRHGSASPNALAQLVRTSTRAITRALVESY